MAGSAARLDILALASPGVVERFLALRSEAEMAGPLDATTCELVQIAALCARGQAGSLRFHIRKALDMGIPAGAIRHAMLLTIGASALLNEVIEALQVLERETD